MVRCALLILQWWSLEGSGNWWNLAELSDLRVRVEEHGRCENQVCVMDVKFNCHTGFFGTERDALQLSHEISWYGERCVAVAEEGSRFMAIRSDKIK